MAVDPDSADPCGDLSRIVQATFGDCLTDHGTLPVLAIGMIGSTQGLSEAGYLELPNDLTST